MNVGQTSLTTTQPAQKENTLPPISKQRVSLPARRKMSSIFPRIFTYLDPHKQSLAASVVVKVLPPRKENNETIEKNKEDIIEARVQQVSALLEDTKRLEKAERIQEIKSLIRMRTPEQTRLVERIENSESKLERRELMVQLCSGLRDSQAKAADHLLCTSHELFQALEIRKAFLIEDPIVRKNTFKSIAEKTAGPTLLLQEASYFYKQGDFQKNLEILEVVPQDSAKHRNSPGLGLFGGEHKKHYEQIFELLYEKKYQGALNYYDAHLAHPEEGHPVSLSRGDLLLSIAALDHQNYANLHNGYSARMTLGILVKENNIPEIRKLLNKVRDNEVKSASLDFIIEMELIDLAIELLTAENAPIIREDMHKEILCLGLFRLGTCGSIAQAKEIARTFSDSYSLCLELFKIGTSEAAAFAQEIAHTFSVSLKNVLSLQLFNIGTPEAIAFAQEIGRTIDDDVSKRWFCLQLFKIGTPQAITFAHRLARTNISDEPVTMNIGDARVIDTLAIGRSLGGH